MAREINRGGVVGLGTMGAGIAEVVARAGYDVVGGEINDDALAAGRGHVDASTGRAVSRGKLSEHDRDVIVGRIAFTTNRGDLAGADLVIEAIPERLEWKLDLVADLDAILDRDAIIATNTSSLSITTIAAASAHPERVAGLHFFNPAPVQKLVEVIRTELTADDTITSLLNVTARLGKTAVPCGDRAGFVTNYLLFSYLNAAMDVVDRGYASHRDVDLAATAGLGFPMGPFALCDLVGLDTTELVARTIYDETRDPIDAPRGSLSRLVAAGYLGRKSGRGFYDYDAVPPVPETGTAPLDMVLAAVPSAAEPDAAGDFTVGSVHVRVVQRADVVVYAEVIRPLAGDVSAADEVAETLRGVGIPVVVAPVNLVDELILGYLNDAAAMVQSGYASPDDIDIAMRLGCAMPAGPCEIAESRGFGTVMDTLEDLHTRTGQPRHVPVRLLRDLAAARETTFPGRRPSSTTSPSSSRG